MTQKMAEEIVLMSMKDRDALQQGMRREYFPKILVFILVLSLAWLFSWFVMGTIVFGLIASAMGMVAGALVLSGLWKLSGDIRDGRMRVVSGHVSALRITSNGAEIDFQLDYTQSVLKTSFKSRRLTESSVEPFDRVPQGDSRTYWLVIDEREYAVPRSEFFRHPVGAEFKGSFSIRGVYIRQGN